MNLTLPENLNIKIENDESLYQINKVLTNDILNKRNCEIGNEPKINNNEESNNVKKLYEISMKEGNSIYSIEVQNIEAIGSNSEFENTLFLVGKYEKLKNIYKSSKFKILKKSEFEQLKNNTSSSYQDNDNNIYMIPENFDKIREIIKEKNITRIHYVNDLYDNPVLKIGIEELFKNRKDKIYFNIPVSNYKKPFAACILNEFISIYQSIQDKDKYQYTLGDNLFIILKTPS